MALVNAMAVIDGNIVGTYFDSNKANSSSIASVESGSTASKSYSVGDLLSKDGNLYKAISPISQGDSLVVNTNISLTNVEAEIPKLVKTRYTVSSASWSATVDTNNYYTYTLTLSPTLKTTYPPNVFLTGATDSTLPTATEEEQYGNLKQFCNLTAANSLTLYAETKPTSTFYIYVEGEVA